MNFDPRARELAAPRAIASGAALALAFQQLVPMQKRMHWSLSATPEEAQAAAWGAGMMRGMYKPDDNLPSGWVKPVAKPTRESLKTRVAELRTELAAAEAQLREIEEGERLEALVKIRNLMRGFDLTAAELGLAPMLKRRGRPRKPAP